MHLSQDIIHSRHGVTQWKNVGLCPVNFPWPAPDLQLMGNI